MNTRGRVQVVSIALYLLILFYRIVVQGYIYSLFGEGTLVGAIVLLILVGALLTFGTYWALFYKVDREFFFTGVLFPFLAFIPYWALAETFITSLSDYWGIATAAIVVYGALTILIYMFILTVNILNGARAKDLPLGQAAKAAHFIFILIAVYIFLTFIQTSGLDFLIRIALVIAYIGYLTFSAVSMLTLKQEEERYAVGLITLLQTFIFILLSIWPLDTVYHTAIMTVTYYLMMNIAIEMREQITSYIWFEYLLLILFITFTLFTNAVWGVNGTII